jgi:hypothetical protein
LIEILLHGHANVCEYFEYKSEYFVRVGVSIVTVLVTLISEVYVRRIVIEKMNEMTNNLVDIRSFRRLNSSVAGGID